VPNSGIHCCQILEYSASRQLLPKTFLNVGGQGSDLVTSAPGSPETNAEGQDAPGAYNMYLAERLGDNWPFGSQIIPPIHFPKVPSFTMNSPDDG